MLVGFSRVEQKYYLQPRQLNMNYALKNPSTSGSLAG